MLISATALLPVASRAQPVQGLYVSLGAGANFAGDLLSDHELTKVYTTVGPVGLADLGWGFGNGLRLEIEGSYRSNSISGISTRRVNGTLDPLSDVNGRDVTYAVMANIAYDIPAHPFGLQPYVGAGVGYGWLDFGNVRGNGYGLFRLSNDNIFGPAPDRVSFGTAGALAYQGMAGTALPLPGVPGLSATLEYRFFGMASPDVPINRVTTTGDTVNGITPSNFTHNRFIVADQAILIGLRYSFGRPPAPAPAVVRNARTSGGTYSLIPGVLRLGPRNPHRPRPPDHRGRGSRVHQDRYNADRGERLHRHLRHAEIQPGPVDAPSRSDRGGTGEGWGAEGGDQHPGIW